MYDELMDEFLPWFLFADENEFTCPHCNGIIDSEDVVANYNEDGDWIKCPHCDDAIKKDDIG